MERTLDQPQTQSIAYGPIPLVIQDAATSYLDLSFYKDFTLSGDLSHAITPASDPMTFTTNGYTLAPFYNDDTKPYHVYFHRSEPEIVFGAVDSGVQNYAQGDGLTFLDVVWARAPFDSQGEFRHVVGQVSRPVGARGPAHSRPARQHRGRRRPGKPGSLRQVRPVSHRQQPRSEASACRAPAAGGVFYLNYPGGAGLTNGAVFGRISGSQAGRISGARPGSSLRPRSPPAAGSPAAAAGRSPGLCRRRAGWWRG